MTVPTRQLLNRGASILSALVFVALLAGVATTVQYFSPISNPTSQIAAAGPAGASIEPCKPGNVYKVSAATKDLKVTTVRDEVAKCWEWSASRLMVMDITGRYTCGARYGCYKPADSKPKLCEEDGGAKPEKCRIYTCLAKEMLKDKNGKECTLLGDFDPDKAEKIFECEKLDKRCVQALNSSRINSQPLTDLLKTADPRKIDIAAMPDAQQREILKAFQDERAAESAKVLSQAAAGKTVEAQINEFVKKNCDNDASNNCLAQIDAQTAKKAGLECRNAVDTGVQAGTCYVPAGDALRQIALNKDLADQVKLEAKSLPPGTPGSLCPSGTGLFPNCGTTGCTGGSCAPDGRGGSTFPNPNAGRNTTGSNSNPMSTLGSLLSGLARAIPPATPPAAPAQACSTDPNIYAQQQQQYQQQLQQYNYQLQQYQYQQQMNQYYADRNGTIPPPQQPYPQQPSACTPSTGSQCKAQPQQPPASACSAGAWRATYSGACISSWRCISTEGPKAELVCEPAIADAGTTLALSYSCSSGVASSSAFKVTTQPGGSATTTVKAPPRGTNTATYTLACTDNGKTTGAQCSVQVNRPSIILVANPKTVPPGQTSLLSWLTTGMDSCVISSPDQPDFTLRNSSNTSVTGAATTSPVATSARFLLHCETLAGGIRDATTTIRVGN